MEKSIEILRKELDFCNRMVDYYNHLTKDSYLTYEQLTAANSELDKWCIRANQTDYLIYLLSK